MSAAVERDQAVTVQRNQVQRLSVVLEAKREVILNLVGSEPLAKRMVHILLSDAARRPELLNCPPETIAYCLLFGAQHRLQVGGPLAEVYLIPRRNKHHNNIVEAEPSIGYRGLAKLICRHPDVKNLESETLYRGEETSFVADKGRGIVEHPFRWGIARNAESVIGSYAFVRLASGILVSKVLTREQLEARRKRSPAVQSGSTTPWSTDYPAMARKSAIRALCLSGEIPLTEELQDVLDKDPDAEEIKPVPFEEVNGQPEEKPMPSKSAIGRAKAALNAVPEKRQLNEEDLEQQKPDPRDWRPEEGGEQKPEPSPDQEPPGELGEIPVDPPPADPHEPVKDADKRHRAEKGQLFQGGRQ